MSMTIIEIRWHLLNEYLFHILGLVQRSWMKNKTQSWCNKKNIPSSHVYMDKAISKSQPSQSPISRNDQYYQSSEPKFALIIWKANNVAPWSTWYIHYSLQHLLQKYWWRPQRLIPSPKYQSQQAYPAWHYNMYLKIPDLKLYKHASPPKSSLCIGGQWLIEGYSLQTLWLLWQS